MLSLSAKRLLWGAGLLAAGLQPACSDADASASRAFVVVEPQKNDSPARMVRRLNHSQMQDADYERVPVQ